jgi:c-di-GMP-binding flagellar brake protein YcgR
VIEHRKTPRVPIRVPIFICFEGSILQKTVHLESTDVSAGGIAFGTNRELELNAESMVMVTKLGDLGEPAIIRGRVAHVAKAPETGRYTVGVEFTSFEGTSREELSARIEQWAE